MVRTREPAGEGSRGDGHAGDAGRPRSGGRPRDATLDEAIILATRARLARDGYSNMTIGDIAADAKVTRPTLYRRWSNKFDLVVDALDYGFRKQRDTYNIDLSRLAPREALLEVVRRVDPAYYFPEAVVLMGNFAGEAIRTPDLLEILRKHAVEPRLALVEKALNELQERGPHGRDDVLRQLLRGILPGRSERGHPRRRCGGAVARYRRRDREVTLRHPNRPQ
jgi:AcrR family transcriptional regulator